MTMKKTYTVRLVSGTIGTITMDGDAEAFVGKDVTVHLFDENGITIEQSGTLAEVLEVL